MPQLQFRSDDTIKWLEGFGTGSDGPLILNSNLTDTPIDAACTGTLNQFTLAATNAAFAPGQLIKIHQTQGGTPNTWQYNKILAYTPGTLTLKYPLTNTYTTGAQVIVFKQYSSITINAILTAKSWNGSTGGLYGFFCLGSVGGTGSISLINCGFRGGVYPGGNNNGWTGEGHTAASIQCGAGISTQGSGGGSASASQKARGSGGGNALQGGSGSIETGTTIPGGAACGNAELTLGNLGGGGGSPADNNVASTSGTGGRGAGFFNGVAVNWLGTLAIVGNGQAGIGSSYWPAGSGAGASLLFKGVNVNLGTGLASAQGGAASGSGGGGQGGPGALGRIHVDYSGTFVGTASPVIDARKDATVVPLGGGAFFNHLLA